jgi:hypothetical protein
MNPRIAVALVVLVGLAVPTLAADTKPDVQLARAPQSDVKTPPPPILPEGPGLLPARSSPAVDAPGPRRQPALHAARRARFERALVDEPGDGRIWARGEGYKASFDDEGASYVPCFGSSAPRNFPVKLALIGASVGGIEIEFDRAAQPVRDGQRVVFSRGALEELWEIERDRLEQKFVLDALPAHGELVLRIGVQSELDARLVDGALQFANELGHVAYGEATAIDAAGRRFPMTTRFVDGAIELHLASSLIAEAQLPLVIDPIVSTFSVNTSTLDDYAPEVAYVASSDTYVLVCEEAYSGTDHDIYLEILDGTGAYSYSDYVDYTTDYWARPRIASNAIGHPLSASGCLCVAAVGLPSSGARIIRGRAIIGWSGAQYAQFTIAGADGYDKLNPDVGGDPELVGPTYYLVVWQRTFSATDQDVHARRINSDGSLGPAQFSIDNTSGTIDTLPAISKSDGHAPYSSQEWTIVWQRDYSGVHEQIFGAQVHWDGTLTNGTFPIDATSDVVRAPRVSSLLDGGFGPRPYMVVCDIMSSLATDWDILGVVFIGTTFQIGTDIPNHVDIGTQTRDQVSACVDSDGRQFTVAYTELYPFPFYDYDIRVADVLWAGSFLYPGGYPYVCESAFSASTGAEESDACITSTYSGGGARQRYFLGWDSFDALSVGATLDVHGALWNGVQGGCASTMCFGDGTGNACPCGNTGAPGNGCANSVNPSGAHLGFSGNPWLSADSFVLSGSGMPSTAPALYFQGQVAPGGLLGSPFGDGLRCVSSGIVRLGTKNNSGGASQYPLAGDLPISIRGAIPAVGGQYFYQAWYRNADPTYCTTSTFNLTNAVVAIWAP